jgi:hypothetical protein
VIPAGDPTITGDPRPVEIGWHPVAGLAGKWFAEKTGLGKFITEKVHKYPDPTQHWAVLVGDYCHELWMDEDLNVIYINEKINREEWHTFDVGVTRFNDEALKQASQYPNGSVEAWGINMDRRNGHLQYEKCPPGLQSH